MEIVLTTDPCSKPLLYPCYLLVHDRGCHSPCFLEPGRGPIPPTLPHPSTHQALTNPEILGLKVTVSHLIGGLQAAQVEGKDVLYFLALNLG